MFNIYARRILYCFTVVTLLIAAYFSLRDGNLYGKLGQPGQLVSQPKAATSDKPVIHKPRCSFELYRKLSSVDSGGNIDGRGNWSHDEKGSISQYNPSVCQLSYGMWIPTAKLGECLKKNKLQHFTLLGD